jgi:DNA-directed RNA polymerase subunit RPC12/RpoP
MTLAKDLRTCIKCHKQKLKTEFPLSFADNPKSGRRWTCLECGGKSFEGKRTKIFTTTKSYRFNYVQQAKNKPCTDCGQKFPLECMDFDHFARTW